MIKIITTLLIFTLLFTACAERGATLTPKNVQQKPTEKKIFICTKKVTVNTEKVKKETSKVLASPAKSPIAIVPRIDTKVSESPVKEKVSDKDNTLFSFSDDTKNKISGFLIFVIGLMIFI